MIATGTDIKPLEVLLFMRAVRSRVLFEQMLGRGTRVISETDFQSVTTTRNARKTRFVIVDAVGATEQELVDTSTVERKRSVPLKSLLEAVAVGAADQDALDSLARRLALLDRRLNPDQRQQVADLLDVPAAPERFTSLRDLSNALLDAGDPDKIVAAAQAESGLPEEALSEAQLESARRALFERAVIPLAASPELRGFLLEREILIDETSIDGVIDTGYDTDATERARQLVGSFQQFIEENRDQITALQILFSWPYTQRRLNFPQVRELAERLQAALHTALQSSDPLLLTEDLWRAYTQLEKDRVHGAKGQRILADLVSLVRHAALAEDLVPYPERVQARYQTWLLAQENNDRQFTPQQRWWLDEIARHIGINISIRVEDLNAYGFQARGGQVAASEVVWKRTYRDT